MSHFFAHCASQKTHGHARIARVSHAIREFREFRVQFSQVRVFSDWRNVQERATKSEPLATAYRRVFG